MFETFPGLLAKMSVFNTFNRRHDEVAKRINSIQRKLFNAMFFIESADSYTPSRTGQVVDNVKEMRAMDAYTDASMAELHGALDMIASSISIAYGLSNNQGRPYSYAQMFDKSQVLKSTIARKFSNEANTALTDLMCLAMDLINENNGSKHQVMSGVFLTPEDYPDYLMEMSRAIMPALGMERDIRTWLAELRRRTNILGHKICEVVPMLFA